MSFTIKRSGRRPPDERIANALEIIVGVLGLLVLVIAVSFSALMFVLAFARPAGALERVLDAGWRLSATVDASDISGTARDSTTPLGIELEVDEAQTDAEVVLVPVGSVDPYYPVLNTVQIETDNEQIDLGVGAISGRRSVFHLEILAVALGTPGEEIATLPVQPWRKGEDTHTAVLHVAGEWIFGPAVHHFDVLLPLTGNSRGDYPGQILFRGGVVVILGEAQEGDVAYKSRLGTSWWAIVTPEPGTAALLALGLVLLARAGRTADWEEHYRP